MLEIKTSGLPVVDTAGFKNAKYLMTTMPDAPPAPKELFCK
jgi:hypothetical protein